MVGIFFHASPNPLVLPQKPVRTPFPQVDSHDFAEDSRFFHGPHELEKHEHHETDDVPMDFSGYICTPFSAMKVTDDLKSTVHTHATQNQTKKAPFL